MTYNPSSGLQLRPFSPLDYAALIAWLPTQQDFYLFSGTTAGWPVDETQLAQRAAQSDITAWTSVLSGGEKEPVGHIELVRTARETGRLARVLVAPGFRGRGLGNDLVRSGLRAARTIGIQTVNLNVVVGNEPALRTYRHLGFRLLGINPDHPAMLQMSVDLGAEG